MVTRQGHTVTAILAASHDDRAIKVRYNDNTTAWLFTWDCVIRSDEQAWYDRQLADAPRVSL